MAPPKARGEPREEPNRVASAGEFWRAPAPRSRGEVVEGLLAVALERRAVHDRQRRRARGRRAPAGSWPVCGARHVAWNIASAASAGSTTSSVVRAGPRTDLGEEVAAQQRAGGLLEEDLGLPAVGHVRRGDLADPLAAEVDAPRPRRAARGGRSHRSLSEMSQPRAPCATWLLGRGREPHVHRAALVGLDVAEGDPAQRLDRQHRGHRLGDQREHARGARCGTAAARRPTTRNWLKVKPSGLTSGIQVEIR